MDIFDILNRQLIVILQAFLPTRQADWWSSLVLEKLSFQQQLYAKKLPSNSLHQLDLSCLLRITDQNWYGIATHLNIDREAKYWLKEAQSIHNRWAHAPTQGIADDMRYRDIDTIERLLQTLGTDSRQLDIVTQQKKLLLIEIAKSQKPAQETESNSKNTFKIGDIVQLKADSQKTGAVIDVITGGSESRYKVFHQNAYAIYYESQLILEYNRNLPVTVTPEDLHATMSAIQLRHPGTTHLYSLFSSRIIFVPYQFRPVLKLIKADRPRLLIADEVGVGKTIEAGLILKELEARGDIKSVLVICPKPLITERKWQQEMKRFDERFEHLDSAALRYCIEETELDGIWPKKYARAILPYSLLDEALLIGRLQGKSKQRGLLELDPPPVFDLVIVDEAHTIRNTDTWAYRNVRFFCDNAEAVVLMSATPIQMGDNDLYNLLNLLRPDVITSRQDFMQMAEPNSHLNAAIDAARSASTNWKNMTLTAIEGALATTWGCGVLMGDPRMQQVCDGLRDEEESPEIRLEIIRKIEELYTFSAFINRTRRRDIGSFFTLRKPETVTVDFTPEQAALHHDLIDLLTRMLKHRHGDVNIKFMLSTVRRQIASSVFGLAPLLQAMLNRHLTQLELTELDVDQELNDVSDIPNEFRIDVNNLIQRAEKIATGPDPKLQAFLRLIRDKQTLNNNKLLVFTCFRHTWEYLGFNLNKSNIRVGLIHGSVRDEERRELRNRFSLPKEDDNAIDVLLSSEVGCEGLDYQFCDALVNYDLPWNPMRVEQRIGRIDRYGQKSQSIVIYNFITPGTVDAEIYERCLLRIGIFQQALGGNEEILGRLTKEIKHIAENLTLTTEEQAARLQQLSDNEIRTLQEQARLEEEQSKLFGLNQPQQDEDMIKQASSFWLTPRMLANLISRHLKSMGANNIPASLGQKPIVTLQLGQDIRDKLLAEFQKLKSSGEMAQAWVRWLKGNDPYLSVTFDQATSAERREATFITPNHPLVQQAALSIEPDTPILCNLKITSDTLPKGQYPYAIYRWQKYGLKEDFTFKPISVIPKLTAKMLTMLEVAEPLDDENITITPEQEKTLEENHYQLWLDARAVHIQQVQEHARARLDSLTTTHKARMALLQEQYEANPSEKIQRMKKTQMDYAERDYRQHAEQLKQSAQQADILAEAVAFGVFSIIG